MNPPDPLDDLLATWQVETRTPAGFQRQVWHRIAADQKALPWATRIFSWWFQPQRLLVSAAVAIAIGGLVGFIEAGVHRRDAREVYFSAINPLDREHQHIIAAK